jgi:hypothetical protein
MLTPDNIADKDHLLFIIGGKNELSQDKAIEQAKWVNLACTLNTRASIFIGIDGYDDDPRELYEIPETVQYIGWFAIEMHRRGLPPDFAKRLAPESLRWSWLA